MWILERQGTDYNDIREFESLNKAHETMTREFNLKNLDENMTYKNCCENTFEIAGYEYYQAWSIYEKSEEIDIAALLKEMELECNRTYIGIKEFCWELDNTSPITVHLDKLQKMINKLSEELYERGIE